MEQQQQKSSSKSPREEPPSQHGGMSVVVQQVDEAFLLVDNENEWVHIGKGVVIYICFLQGASQEMLPKVVKALLGVKLFQVDGKAASVMEAQRDIMIVPQASLSGKLKGNRTQYHGQANKEEAETLYDTFISLIKANISNTPDIILKHGTYGNRQGLRIVSSGPYTHHFTF
ncbi:D-tyrosyl-tRNA(Tyr) deacylase [Balamuthia mandrillaris]